MNKLYQLSDEQREMILRLMKYFETECDKKDKLYQSCIDALSHSVNSEIIEKMEKEKTFKTLIMKDGLMTIGIGYNAESMHNHGIHKCIEIFKSYGGK